MSDFITNNMPMIVDYGVKAIGALVAFIVLLWIAGIVRKIVKKGVMRGGLDDTLSTFISNMARYAVLIAGGVAILGMFGIETTSFAAILGAASLAIGMAFQGTLGHLASGVLIMVFRPFKIGDVVKAGGEIGAVNEIGLFVTSLDTPDNRRIIVPNGTVTGGVIENWSHFPNRRVDVNVGTDYTADLDKTREVLQGAIKATSKILPGQPHTPTLMSLGDSCIDWQVRAYCDPKDYFGVLEELTYNTKKALDDANIGIPYPQMDVHQIQ